MDFIKGEILAIDKPYGMTSFGALAHIRFLLSQKLGQKVKVGHAGTLDPLATGVLILCTGRCTKQIETLQSHTKEYTATLLLGATTASYDREHEVNATYPVEHITRELILDTLKQFEGDIQQVPPTYSACKVEGTRAYQLRRNGEAVELKPKAIHIDKVELTDYDGEKKTMAIRVVCGKGTYIRALARDIGRTLNSGAYLTSLRRTRVGDICESDCIEFNHFGEWLDSEIPNEVSAASLQRPAEAKPQITPKATAGTEV
jgi:tRNA pseudouridine55 synthase